MGIGTNFSVIAVVGQSKWRKEITTTHLSNDRVEVGLVSYMVSSGYKRHYN